LNNCKHSTKVEYTRLFTQQTNTLNDYWDQMINKYMVYLGGATENARMENSRRSKSDTGKSGTGKSETENADLDNAKLSTVESQNASGVYM